MEFKAEDGAAGHVSIIILYYGARPCPVHPYISITVVLRVLPLWISDIMLLVFV
jgi:hypothetical protein